MPTYEIQTDPIYSNPSYPHSIPTPTPGPVITTPPEAPEVGHEVAPADPNQSARAKSSRPLMPVVPNPKGPAIQTISRPKVTARPISAPVASQGSEVSADLGVGQTSRLPPVEVVSGREEVVVARPMPTANAARPLLDKPAVPPRQPAEQPKQAMAPKLPIVPPLAAMPSRAAVPAKMVPAPVAATPRTAQPKKKLAPVQPIYVGSSPSETLRR